MKYVDLLVMPLVVALIAQRAGAQTTPPVGDTARGGGLRAPGTVPTTGPTGTFVPTDITRTPLSDDLPTFGQNLNIRLLQKLPAPLFVSSSVETSFRYETNPFQFPKRSILLRKLGLQNQAEVQRLNPVQRAQVFQLLSRANNDDVIFRVLPNTTVGWALGSRTRVFGNHFLIRDHVYQNRGLSTTINSLSVGAQRDFPIGARGNLQADFQARELFIERQQPVFDFLPGLTFTYVVTPRTVAFVNTLLQMRGKKFFQAPTKEIDPFYSFGMLHQRNGWSFSSTATFVQNFREPFRGNAAIPINNYSWILDFEVARRLIRQVPGLQAFVRAEPIFNFHSNNTPGLAGFDMRVFFGLRAAVAKRPLNNVIEQIREDIMDAEEQENRPSRPVQPPSPPVKLRT